MRAARQHYAKSEFRECTRLLERALVQGEALPSDVEKRIYLWLGLCRAVADQADPAAVAFARAKGLSGPEPDPDVFPPHVMKLYRRVDAIVVSESLKPEPVAPWYERHWWIWIAAGAVVVAAIAVPVGVAATSGDHYTLTF